MFRFRFARLLKYRLSIVDERARAVKEAAEFLAAAKRSEQEALQQIVRLTRQCAQGREQSPDAERQRQQANFLTAWRRDLDTLRQRREEAATTLAVAQENLVAAYRDQEVLEQLERRQRSTWETEQRRRERKLLDEIGSIRAALKTEYR